MRRMSEIGLKQPGVAHAVEFAGMSVNGFTQSSSAGIVFFPLDDFAAAQRASARRRTAIAAALNQKLAGIQDAFVVVFTPPPVIGLGTLGGFKLQVEDRGRRRSGSAVRRAVQDALGKADQEPGARRGCSAPTRSTCRSWTSTSIASRSSSRT